MKTLVKILVFIIVVGFHQNTSNISYYKQTENNLIYRGKNMSFDKDHFRELIREVLKEFDVVIYSNDAVELTMLTVAQESWFGKALRQNGNGVALGVIQMEPETEKDIWENFLKYKPEFVKKIVEMTGVTNYGDKLALKGNLIYQIIMVRIHYYRNPYSLPNSNNLKELAIYYKKHYNTYLGKATVEEAIENYERYCG